MALVIPDEGALELLVWQLKAALAADVPLSVGLYKNDYHPAKSSHWTDFAQADFPGYFRQDVPRSGWGDPVIVDGRASSTHGAVPFEWANTGDPQTLYGYFVLNPATFKVTWAERFASAQLLATGGKLKVRLVRTLVSEFLS